MDGGKPTVDQFLNNLIANEIETDSIEINDKYILNFPTAKPATAGLSLTIQSIQNDIVQLQWSLSSSSSTGLKQGNNSIVFKAVDSLSSSYNLRFPDYNGSTNTQDTVLIVTADDGAGNIDLGFQNLRFGTVPTMTAANTLKTLTLVSEHVGMGDIKLTFPTTSVAEAASSMFAVFNSNAGLTTLASSATDTDIVFDFAIPSTVATPKIFNTLGSKMTFSVGRSSKDLNIRMPSYDGSNYTGEALQVASYSTGSVDEIEYGFSRDFFGLSSIKIGNMTLHGPDEIATDHGHELTISLPDTLADCTTANEKVLSVASYSRVGGQPHVQLGFSDPLQLKNNSNIFTFRFVAAPSLAKSFNFLFPSLSTALSQVGSSLSVFTDEFTRSLPNTRIAFDRKPRIGNEDNSNDSKVRLRTANNALDYSIFLPNHDPAVDVTNKALRVVSNSFNTVTLDFLEKNVIIDSSGLEIIKIDTPAAQTAHYELILPEFLQSIQASYAGKIVKVKNSSPSSISLEFGDVDAFSNLQQISLVHEASSYLTTLTVSASASTNLEITLPAADSTSPLRSILSNSKEKNIGENKAKLKFRTGGALPSRTYEEFTTFVANPSQTADAVLLMPSVAVKKGFSLLLRDYNADGSANLEFEHPNSLVLPSASSANKCTVSAPALSSSYSLRLPTYSDSLKGEYVGRAIRVISQASSAVETEFVYNGRLFASGATGPFFDLLHSSGDSYEFIFPSMNVGTNVVGNFLVCTTSAAGEIEIGYKKNPTPTVQNKIFLSVQDELSGNLSLSLPAEPLYKKEFVTASFSGSRIELKSEQMLRLPNVVLRRTNISNVNSARGHEQQIHFPIFEEVAEPIVVSSVTDRVFGATPVKVVRFNEERSTLEFVSTSAKVVGTRATFTSSVVPLDFAVDFSSITSSGCATMKRVGNSFEAQTSGLYLVSVDISFRVEDGQARGEVDEGKNVRLVLQDANVTHTLYDVDQSRSCRRNFSDSTLFRFHDLSVALASRPERRRHFEFVANLPSGKLFFLYVDHNNASDSSRIISTRNCSVAFTLLD